MIASKKNVRKIHLISIPFTVSQNLQTKYTFSVKICVVIFYSKLFRLSVKKTSDFYKVLPFRVQDWEDWCCCRYIYRVGEREASMLKNENKLSQGFWEWRWSYTDFYFWGFFLTAKSLPSFQDLEGVQWGSVEFTRLNLWNMFFIIWKLHTEAEV